MIRPFSGFACWALPGSWQQKTPAFPNAWNLCKTKKEMEEREKESVHGELIPVYIFILCLLDWSPTSCQLTRLTAILAERHRLRGTLIHPSPWVPAVTVCSWVSKVNVVREVQGCWSCVFQSQGRPPSHQQIHASVLCIMPLFTHKFYFSLEKHLAQIRQFTLELCVCVCRYIEWKIESFFFFLNAFIPIFKNVNSPLLLSSSKNCSVMWSQILMCINSHYHNRSTAVRLLLKTNYSVEYIRRTKPKQAKLCVLPSCKLSIWRYKTNCSFHFTCICFLFYLQFIWFINSILKKKKKRRHFNY